MWFFNVYIVFLNKIFPPPCVFFFFRLYFLIYFIFGSAWSCCAKWGLLCRSAGLLIAAASLVAERRLWGTQGSAVAAQESVAAAGGLWALGAVAVVHSSSRGLRCSAARGVLRIRARTRVPCMGRWILYHQATTVAPPPCFLWKWSILSV